MAHTESERVGMCKVIAMFTPDSDLQKFAIEVMGDAPADPVSRDTYGEQLAGARLLVDRCREEFKDKGPRYVGDLRAVLGPLERAAAHQMQHAAGGVEESSGDGKAKSETPGRPETGDQPGVESSKETGTDRPSVPPVGEGGSGIPARKVRPRK